MSLQVGDTVRITMNHREGTDTILASISSVERQAGGCLYFGYRPRTIHKHGAWGFAHLWAVPRRFGVQSVERYINDEWKVVTV